MVKDKNYALAKGLVTLVAGLAFSMMPVKLVAQDLNASEKAAAVEQRVAKILASMSVEQKVGQMIQPEIKFVSPSDVKKYHIGSILNGGGSFPGERKNSAIQDWVDLADAYYNASVDTSNGGTGIPIIWGTDAVHGHNNVIGATLFPHNIGLGAANDPQL